jgi:hypothetical protein
MENIYAIVISDFGEKIHFFHKKLDFDYEHSLKILKSLNKSLAANYLREYVANGLDMRMMDTMINSKLKIKISIVGEIIVEILYDSNIDFNYLNAVNQRLLEALYLIAKTKKIKIEHLNKRFPEVNQILEDSLFLFDPRIRISSKNVSLKESQHVTIIIHL